MTGETKAKGLANMVLATWGDMDTMPADYGRAMARLIVEWCEARRALREVSPSMRHMEKYRPLVDRVRAAEAALAEAGEGTGG